MAIRDRGAAVVTGRIAILLVVALMFPPGWLSAGEAAQDCTGCSTVYAKLKAAKAQYEARRDGASWQAYTAAHNKLTGCITFGCATDMKPGEMPDPPGQPGDTGGGDTTEETPPPEPTTVTLDQWTIAVRAEQDGYLPDRAETQGEVEATYYDEAQLDARSTYSQQMTITGVVRDPTGTPVPHARVALEPVAGTTTNPRSGTVETDDQGWYGMTFEVTGLESLPGQPPDPVEREIDLVIEPSLVVEPRELTFTPGKESVQVFSIVNRGDRDVDISTLRVVGSNSVRLNLRGGQHAGHGSESLRCLIGPGGYCNVEVTWTAGADIARIDVVPANQAIRPSVMLRPAGAHTPDEIVKQYFVDLLNYLSKLDNSAAQQPSPGGQSGSAGQGTGTPTNQGQPSTGADGGQPSDVQLPPVLRDDRWIDEWAQQNAARLDRLDQEWQRIAAEKAANSRVVEPAPATPADVRTAPGQTAVVVNIYGGTNTLKIVGSDSQVSVNPPPEKLGPDGARILMEHAEDGIPEQPVLVEDGKIFVADFFLDDPLFKYLDWIPTQRDLTPSFLLPAVDYINEKGSQLVQGTASLTKKAVDAVATGVCWVFFDGTQYEVHHDRATGLTTITVFEGTVEVVPFTGSSSSIPVRAGQRVQVSRNGAGPVTEVPREQLDAISDPYAAPFMGFNPVSGQRVTRWVEDPAVSGEPVFVTPTPNAPATGSDGAITVPVSGDADVYAYTYRNWNRANVGRNTSVVAGWHPTGGEKRAYFHFDLSGLPRVEYAALRLYHQATSGDSSRRIAIFRVTEPWREGTGIYESGTVEQNAAPGELSWEQQPPHDPTPIAVFTPRSPPQWIELEITPLVRQWQTGTPNHGLVIKITDTSPSGGATWYHFPSRESEDADKRPELVVRPAGSAAAPSPIRIRIAPVSTAGHSPGLVTRPAVHTVAWPPMPRASVGPDEIAARLRQLSRRYEEAAGEWEVEHFAAQRSGFNQHRRMLLDALLEEGALSWGESSADVDDLLNLYFLRLPRLEELVGIPEVEETLEPSRYLHLLIVEGETWEPEPESSLMEQVVPELDLRDALDSDDPWVVSAALQLARSEPSVFSVGDVLDRWARGARFWDEACTAQALLYLAALPDVELDTLATDNAWIRRVLDAVEPAPAQGCLLQVRTFSRFPRPDDGPLGIPSPSALWIEPEVGAEINGSTGLLQLAPGNYAIRYLRQQSYSDRYHLSCEPGTALRLVLGITHGV